jgi:prepilin-type N-terminal cleavage/methylation domain-containing protein/prepilin-type processing-associated H-X9-DG protein
VTKRGFTLIEVLVVIAIVAILAAILFPVVVSVKESGKATSCAASMRQIGLAATLYMTDFDGALYHHHEDWVLDDGTQVHNLPADISGCVGGGHGNSQAGKPWAIFFQPYMQSRTLLFCPDDFAPRTRKPAGSIEEYNGAITQTGTECGAAPDGEQCQAEIHNTAMWSYVLNSVFTHKSCRYALEGALAGFVTQSALTGLKDDSLIMFSERNSDGLDDPSSDFYYIPQDDYDTWPGEAALVQWGTGTHANEGWIKYDRHHGGANYTYFDGHTGWMRWSRARTDQYPDHVVRNPLGNPPE